MSRISFASFAVALFALPAAAFAASDVEVLDLVAHPDQINSVVLPKLLDAVLVNPVDEHKDERGYVRLTFVVNTDGTVSDIKITGPSPYFRLNDAAVATVLSRAYVPATKNGKPIAVRIWAIDSFNPDPAVPMVFDALDADADLNFSCRYGTHHIAVDACTAMMSKSSSRAREYLYPRAHAYEQLGQYDLALADYSKLIGSTQSRADLYRNRGFAYEELGQYDKAADDYSHAIKLDPKVVGYYYDRGFTYLRLGKTDLATKDFADAMANRPLCQKVSTRGIGADMGAAAVQNRPAATANPTAVANPFHETKGGGPGSGMSAGSSQVATSAGASSAGGNTTTVMTSGLCTPSWVTPIAELKPIQTGTPDEALKLENRCWTRAVWNKELTTATADCDRALDLNPNFVRAYSTQGWVSVRNGDNTAAMKNLNAAISMSPHLASALYIRGLAKLKAGDSAGGQADILAARATDPEIAATYARYDVGP